MTIQNLNRLFSLDCVFGGLDFYFYFNSDDWTCSVREPFKLQRTKQKQTKTRLNRREASKTET